MQTSSPPYFDPLIAAFPHGSVSRLVHLGHWDAEPTGAAGEFEAAQARMNEILIESAELRDGQDVLDVGCGFGGTLAAIDRQCSGMKLVGANIDPRQLEICATLSSSTNRYQWREADADQLPFPAQSFDRVFCVEAMFHFPSRRRFLKEASRVLKPGGLFIGSDIVVRPLAEQALTVPPFSVEALICDGYGPWPDFWSKDADHAELAAAAGFRKTQILDATANTAPSYRYTTQTPDKLGRVPADPLLRAGLMLRWLHLNGRLQYLYLRHENGG